MLSPPGQRVSWSILNDAEHLVLHRATEMMAIEHSEFTDDAYRALLEVARRGYRFEPFGTASRSRHVLWRHDVDVSVHRALAMARVESSMDVRATYFLLLHSPFYNLLETGVRRAARELATLGHRIGLHFEGAYYEDHALDELPGRITAEQRFLQDLIEVPVEAFSFHNPVIDGTLALDDDEVGGMVNAYGHRLKARYRYISDSNGFWQHDRLPDVLSEASETRLHVLTHPEWWTPETLSPRQRISRAIDGRAISAHSYYDELLERAGRPNVR
jgi:hypothetical protein